ncbi:hypothetical protein GCM10011352_24020 [Marinobacterium zhoushanense]|uniref:CARDB domain-containing protein n=1 Tax=Marinobacterium zhoushanense TaxID=1679163 RepID=A0ABQ1KIN5_9GAMM|nr:CARDB domain-containing protein [Marinobacterium zhoushanense]GGB97071.1 hypothetical protein GCM10011352_24020 [Marinobacterium zhoushanense]
MKARMIKNLIATATLSMIACGTFAAAPNNSGPAPKCPFGQIAVKKNDLWVCEPLKIKAPTKGLEAVPTAGKQYQAAEQTKPARAKPDLTVADGSDTVGRALPNSTPNWEKKIYVHIKNIGSSASQGGYVEVKLSNGAIGKGSMPTINPNQTRLVFVEFRAPLPEGRLVANIKADSTNQIAESNESNNTKTAVFQ